MNDLVNIPCFCEAENMPGVLGTQLHKALGIRTEYRHWFRRVCDKLELREGRDYSTLVKNVRRGDNVLMPGKKIDHLFTVTVAKEICLIEKSPVCGMLRRQLVEAEQRMRQEMRRSAEATEREISVYRQRLQESSERNLELSANLEARQKELAVQAVIILQQKKTLKNQDAVIQKQRKIVKEMRPKVDYCNRVLNSEDVFSVTAIAKSYDWSARKLNKFLHDKHIQYKCDGCWVLYSPYVGKGYTKTVTYVRTCDGVERVRLVMKWTQKGRQFIDRKMREAGWKPKEESQEQIRQCRRKKKKEQEEQ